MEQENNIVLETANSGTAGDSGEESTDVLNLSQTGSSSIKAEKVQISQGGAGQVFASEVEVKQGGVNRIHADNVQFSDGVTAFIQAESVDLKDSGVGAIRTKNISIQDGGAVVIGSETVTMEEGSGAAAIIANQVTGEKISTKLLVTGHVNGNVETMLDTKQVLFAGMAAGAAIGLVLLVGQLFSQRD